MRAKGTAKSLNPVEIGERIRTRREAIGISQPELAMELNTTVTTISRWENGKYLPHLGNMKKIASALNTTVAYLQGRSFAEPEPEPLTIPLSAIPESAATAIPEPATAPTPSGIGYKLTLSPEGELVVERGRGNKTERIVLSGEQGRVALPFLEALWSNVDRGSLSPKARVFTLLLGLAEPQLHGVNSYIAGLAKGGATPGECIGTARYSQLVE